MIVGFAGLKQTGKSTASNVLVNEFGFTPLSFAKPLKDVCMKVFHLSELEVNDPVLKETPLTTPIILTEPLIDALLEVLSPPNLPEVRQPVLDKCLGVSFSTPRQVLQYVGTDLVRNTISETFWTDKMKDELKKNKNSVICDVRFPDERKLLRDTLSHGHKNFIFLIKRPSDVIVEDKHVSENSLGEEAVEYDYGLMNDGTKENFEKLVRYIITGLQSVE